MNWMKTPFKIRLLECSSIVISVVTICRMAQPAVRTDDGHVVPAAHLDRFTLLLEALTDELNRLCQAISRPFPRTGRHRIRTGEHGFRPVYTMNRDGSNALILAAAPDMIGLGTAK